MQPTNDETQLRVHALDFALRTCNTPDKDAVLAAAKDYLNFMTGKTADQPAA